MDDKLVGKGLNIEPIRGEQLEGLSLRFIGLAQQTEIPQNAEELVEININSDVKIYLLL